MTRRHRYNPAEVWLVTAWPDRYDLKCKRCAYQTTRQPSPLAAMPAECPACKGEVPKPPVSTGGHWPHARSPQFEVIPVDRVAPVPAPDEPDTEL